MTPAQHPVVGDRYTCRTDNAGIRTVTVTRVWDLGDGATVAIEWPGSGGEHRMSLDVFTGASRRLCSTPGPDASICDLPAGHTGRHEELGYGRLTTWTDEQPAADAAIEEQQEPALDDTCRVVDIDGEPVRVRGAGGMSGEARTALAGVIGAARRRHAAEQARHDAQVRAAAYREAASIAHTEGARLYDDMGQRAADGAWAVRDLLRARADEISGHSTQPGGEQRPEPPMRQAVNALAAQLHDEDPTEYHGTGGPGDCTRCAAAYVPPAHFTRDDGTACCAHTTPVGPGSCAACWDLVKWGTAGGEQQ